MTKYYLQIEEKKGIKTIIGISDNDDIFNDSPKGFLIEQFTTTEENFNPIGKVFKDGKIVNNLAELKEQKIHSLEKDFKLSKTVILKNGETLIIDAETPERKYFKENLEKSFKIEDVDNSILSYWQKTGTKTLGFRVLSYVWRKIFADLFIVGNSNIFEMKSSINRRNYDVIKTKIENTLTEANLNQINWNFLQPVTIDINEEAYNILNDFNSPKAVKDAINDLKDADGQIHLIVEQI